MEEGQRQSQRQSQSQRQRQRQSQSQNENESENESENENENENQVTVARIVESMREILVGEPTQSMIEQTLSKYCSKDICWQIHDTTYTFHELIPYVHHSRNRSMYDDQKGRQPPLGCPR